MEVYHYYLHGKRKLFTDPIAACIGYFDGLHLGHQKLIEKTLEIAEKHQVRPALITFDPDPWVVLKGLENIPHLTPMEHRMEIGEQLGIERWIILHFDRELAALSWKKFHELVLNDLHLHTLICGYDFHYAHKGEGSVETLRSQQHFHVAVIDEVSSDHKKISSSRIEELITQGEMEKAQQFLGRPYEIRGVIVKGRMVGRKHGFPTANLKLSASYLSVALGVYAGEVKVKGRWHPAMINVGHNPTYNFQREISIEAHILDFDEDIYGEQAAYRFLHYLRPEKKFKDAEALSEQLRCDLTRTRHYAQKKEKSA